MFVGITPPNKHTFSQFLYYLFVTEKAVCWVKAQLLLSSGGGANRRDHFHFCLQPMKAWAETLRFVHYSAAWMKERVKSASATLLLFVQSCTSTHLFSFGGFFIWYHSSEPHFAPLFFFSSLNKAHYFSVPPILPPPRCKFASICSRFGQHSWPEWQFKSLLVRPKRRPWED